MSRVIQSLSFRVVLLALALTGCGRAPEPNPREIVSLHLLGIYSQEAQSLAHDFERQTGIRVKIVGATIHSLREKTLTDLLTHGGNFDVLQVPYQWDEEILPRLRPLDEAVKQLAPRFEDFIPVVKTNCGYWDGHTYGLPMACDAITLLYRTDVFAARSAEFQQQTGRPLEPPKTWEEYLQIAEFLDGESLYGNIIMGGDQLYTIWAGILYGLGGSPMDAQWQPTLNTEAGRRSLELFRAMFKFAPPRSEKIGVPEASRLFLQGRGAMYLTWPSLVWGQINDTNVCRIAGNIGATTIPGGRPQLSAWSLGVNPACRDFEAACRWISFFVNESNSKRLLLSHGKGSPRLATYEDAECRRQIFYLPALLKGLEGSTPRFRIKPSQQLLDVLDGELARAVAGQSSIPEALDRSEARWREILNRFQPVRE